ncbi:hypothetical protein HYFRA_00010628 [Hymenoscyphus fraxineus]|uniref:EDC4-like protein pdc1 beta-propeller domain-containing protein n=1 Tax=Hymenoscyphus fraxineus TaxID=746836 RepID=A0A9N9L631_9HELO|nr:hypothetical protein HYFRA_00010628 [Hymenoscyphus fraxineus]
MSGFPGAAGESNGLDNLFAQLRSQQQKPPVALEPSYSYYPNNNNAAAFFGQQPSPAHHQQHPSHGYHQPAVSSPLPTPPMHNQQPHHSSAVMSPAMTPQARIPSANGGQANADRTSSLLNLLKFSQPSGGSATQPPPIGTPLPPSREPSMNFGSSDIHGQVSASAPRAGSDLLAALMAGSQPRAAQEPSVKAASIAPVQHNTFTNSASSPPPDTQAYLLQLLNQPKPSQSEASPHMKPANIMTPPSKNSSSDEVEEITKGLDDTSLNMSMMGSAATESMPAFGKENIKEPAAKNSQGLFTYVNPFDQLAASSPRNRTPKATSAHPVLATSPSPAIQILKKPRQSDSPDNKRKLDERSTISSPAHTKRKIDSSTPKPSSIVDDRSALEKLIGIGSSGPKESVHDALSEVGTKANKQAQEAIVRAEREESQASIEQDLRNLLAAETDAEFKHQAESTAQAIKEQLEKEENSGALDGLPTPVAEAVKEIIDETAQGHIADSWESADAEADENMSKASDEVIVPVYNFPMKPWVSISIKDTEEPRPTFREGSVMDIARLKKEFDQVDRTLVTASGTFIVYGMSKNGGIRIIRQEDGEDARIFTETQDRIFSVVTSSSPADLKESVIATGISGTVYWVLIKDGEGDHLDDSMPEMYGFALPPVPAQDNETSGGVLKTRARKSSSHPDFFGVGRGKYIHVIFPPVILKQSFLKKGKDRLVDTDRYLNHLSLKINTGKAGKDFTFSEDDSTIVSLDKAGKVKFWDIRDLTKNNGSQSEHIEIRDPLITFTTTPANEKSWPTSVLFVDKLRPYQKGGALRYMIIGMKQNHTLQLWDLALQKPVQEIHLPHIKESDAVCSVVYHAATGMIVVGHPTRNSIYFLHLSAPKYNVHKSVTQADYMEKIVANDPTILKPDSTAVISGMREYSFADKGILRSLDILQQPSNSSAEVDPPIMFELYCMHSKGVTCLLIKQADLGWSLDNKVLNPRKTPEADGIISLEALKEPAAPTPVPEVSEPATQSVPMHIVPRPAAKDAVPKETPKKAVAAEPSSTSKAEEKKEPLAVNGGLTPTAPGEKSEKKKRRKANSSAEPIAGPSSTSQNEKPKTIVLDPSSHSRNGNVSKANNNTRAQAQDLSDSTLKGIENRVSAEMKKTFTDSLDVLYKSIKDDRRTQDAVSEAKQDAMLRLVSSTLSDNIEATLGRIVQSSIQKSVLPVISDVTTKVVSEQLGSKLNAHIAQTTPKELQKALPDAISRALQQPQLLDIMSKSLAQSVAFQVQDQFHNVLHDSIIPSFKNLAIQSTQKIVADVQRETADQISVFERQRYEDSVKIEQLTQLVTGLSETVSSMAAAQTEFQGQFLRLQKQAALDRRGGMSRQTDDSVVSADSPSNALAAIERAPSPQTPEELEYQEMLEKIQADMAAGEYEKAVIQWLQTKREQEFFARFFSNIPPDFTRELSPLMLLSLGAIITATLEDQFLEARLNWMDNILATFQAKLHAGDLDDQARNLIPKLMGIYTQRLEHLFMRVNNISPNNAYLKRFSMLINVANRILDSSRNDMRSREHSISGTSMMSGSRYYQ